MEVRATLNSKHFQVANHKKHFAMWTMPHKKEISKDLRLGVTDLYKTGNKKNKQTGGYVSSVNLYKCEAVCAPQLPTKLLQH